MRVVFAGTPQVAVPSLRAIVEAGHDVVAVLTQPDAPGKRRSAPQPSPVSVAARELELPVLTPTRASDDDTVATLKALKADVAAVVAFGQILKPAMLGATRVGWVNLHFSVLPAWRGAAPVQRAIMAGDDITGASTFLIEEGLDTGPVIGLLTERIRATDTTGDLLDRLATVGAPLLVQSIEALVNGMASPVPQGDDGVSYAHKITREDALVAWDRPAHIVDRQIRAVTPAPGAWTTLPDGTVAKIGPVQVRTGSPLAPGFLRAEEQVFVGTGTDPVALTWIAPAGKRAMDARDWWRGARLGESAALGEV